MGRNPLFSLQRLNLQRWHSRNESASDGRHMVAPCPSVNRTAEHFCFQSCRAHGERAAKCPNPGETQRLQQSYARGRAGRGPRWWLKQRRRRNWTRPLGRTYRTIPCVGQRRRRTFKLLPTQICKERSRNGRISFKWINKRNGSHLSAFAAYGGQSRLRSTGAGGSSTGKDSRHASDATGTAGDRGEIRTASEGEEALSLLRPSQRLGILELFAAPRLVS